MSTNTEQQDNSSTLPILETKLDIRVDGIGNVLRAAFEEHLKGLHNLEVTPDHNRYISVAIDSYIALVRQSFLAKELYGKGRQNYTDAAESIISELTSENRLLSFAYKFSEAIDKVVKEGRQGLLHWSEEEFLSAFNYCLSDAIQAGVRKTNFESQVFRRAVDYTMGKLLAATITSEHLDNNEST